MSDIETIDIPERTERGGAKRSPEVEAFIAAMRDGKAVRFPLNGHNHVTLCNRFHSAANTRGMKAHTRREGGFFVAWATKRTL